MPFKGSFENRKPIDDSISRICKVCNLSKQLNLEFRYISTYDCYLTYCKDCENKRRRLKYANLPIPVEYSILKDVKSKRKKKVYENKPYRKTSYVNRKRLDYRAIDKKRGWENDLTVEFVEKSLSSPCTYCGFPAVTLDRLDNDKGHLMNNCIPACYECNIARNKNFSIDEMKLLGKIIREIKLKRLNNGQ